MNTKIRTILTAGMLLATVLPVAACAKKAPSANTVPTTTETVITETEQTEQTGESETITEQTETSQETTAVTPISFTESEETVQDNEQQNVTVKKTETAKKTASKTSKKTAKKTTKKITKKTKATSSDKGNSNPTKETSNTPAKSSPKLFSFGSCTYVCKDITIKMFIKKNDYATVSVTYKSQDRNDRRREVYYTMSGQIDSKTNTLKYSNCTKQELVYTDLGLFSSKVDYKKGTGEITFKKGHKLVWNDSMQHFADSLTFAKQA